MTATAASSGDPDLRQKPLRFDGRTVLVTGAGRGMGLSHARYFAALGANVVIADAGVSLHGDMGDVAVAVAAVTDLRAAGAQATGYTADLATEEGARGAVRHALAQFGRIDVLVHNAGFTLGAMPFERETLDRLDKQLAVNSRAGFVMAQEAWPHFQAAGGGQIVLAGSTAMYGLPSSTPYSTAKASYIGLARALADEGATQNIRVNLVAAAGATRMAENMPASEFRNWFMRTMRPDHVSPVIAWLAHPASNVSGEIFVVGGGRIARTLLSETAGVLAPGATIDELQARRAAIIGQSDAAPVPTFQSAMDLMFDALGFRPSASAPGYAGVASASPQDRDDRRRP